MLPALLGLPIIVERSLRNRREPLLIFLLLLSTVYVYGFLADKFAYGRVISQITLILHLALAGWLTCKLKVLFQKRGPHDWRITTRMALTCSCIALVLWQSFPGIHSFASKVRHTNATTTQKYRFQFLAGLLHDEDVVMADPVTAQYVPAWGGKVVTWPFSMPFIIDRDTRTRDVATFFASGTNADTRSRLAEKYAAKWVLMDVRDTEERAAEASIVSLGEEVYTADGGSLVLIRLRPT
jgi:hypothetical protein